MHSKGLKFGIYSCAGRKTCQNRPGSRGYEFQDAISYAGFGVDFLKLDWCNSEGQNAVEAYTFGTSRMPKKANAGPVVLSFRDVFAKSETGTTAQIITREIPSHDVVVFRLKKKNQ